MNFRSNANRWGSSLSLVFLTAIPLTIASASDPVSFYEDIRPLFQAKCHGCHQPAKAKGDFVMTSFEKLLAGGETAHAIVPRQPAESFLIENIAVVDGEAEMPPKDDPFTAEEFTLIERWITEGAVNDTPENAVERFSPEHPPRYHRPPVITSVDFSPDGKLLAVSGFHEVLLHHADGSGLAGRLVGLSERIESVRFSPDGTRLAVTGGLPERMGELQIWDVAKHELDLSVPIGHDTIYGASWSPDGSLIAVGLPDNTLRAFDAKTGKQVVFMGGHNDWVLDTTFNQSGEHIISVGRDMSTKLTEVKTERFVDNLSSITPGALVGGIGAVALHPLADHILVGGSDGAPQIYRTVREVVRKIGDNANLIRRYPAMPGRVWDVAFRPDGKRFAAGSSLNGKGAVHIYRSEYDATIPDDVKKAMGKARNSPGAKESAEQKLIDAWQTKNAEQLVSLDLDSAIYAVAWSPDQKTVVAGGEDGRLRFIDPATGKITKDLVPVQIDQTLAAEKPATINVAPALPFEAKETLPQDIVSLDVIPREIALDGPARYAQLIVTARLGSGATADVTRFASFVPAQGILEVTPRGKAVPKADGETVLNVTVDRTKASVPVTITGFTRSERQHWVEDVNPVISRMGCNTGTCHGAKDGKDGFKLSLRGYDPLFDVRAFTDDINGRRVNYASPDDSLMLLKMTGAVPHEGGQLAKQHSTYYNIVRDWIAHGAKLEADPLKVKRIELFPRNPVIQNIGHRQQMRVVATFTDGSQRDVTAEAFVESGNGEVAEHDDHALLSTLRRGEAPLLARYEGAYAATTLTVMGDRTGFQWAEAPVHNEIDRFVAAKWQRLKIAPSGPCTDEQFVRRVYLDLTGLPPTSGVVPAFTVDPAPQRQKRDRLIDQLIGSPDFVDHWTNKWSDMLLVNSKFLGGEGARIFRDWIKAEVEANTPYNEFVYQILTATGSNKENPAASYYKILREPDAIVENTTHLFLATRFNCNKCHDHPFERWTQDQYYETAAWFAQVGLKRDGKNAPNQSIGQTAVEAGKPLYEMIEDMPGGELNHDRTGEIQPPAFPYPAKLAPVSFRTPDQPTRREELAAWITSDDNDYFALSYANRIWGYLLGTGIIEPLDDIRAGNPPSNPELLNWLTARFIESGFDVRQLMATICKSRTYQLSIETNRWNEDDTINFAHAKAKRLPAEVLYDAVYAVTGATPDIPGAGKGVRASQLPDAKLDLKSGFLANLGRPVRESACECERNDDLQMSAVMAFLSGPAIADAVGAKDSALTKLTAEIKDDRKLIEAIYYRVLARAPRPAEVETALSAFREVDVDHQRLQGQLQEREAWWVPLEFDRNSARLDRIVTAANAIKTYTPAWDAKVKKAVADQDARIANAEKAEAGSLKQIEARRAQWETSVPVSQTWTAWHPLKPTKASSTAKAFTVSVQENGSVLAASKAPPKAKTDYLVDFKASPLQTVTGLAIAAFPHESLTGFGPGLHSSGNFVVTEVEFSLADAKGKLVKQKLKTAKVDHIQQNFKAALAIDGNPNNQNAWAVGGKEREPHWLRLQFEKPLQISSPDTAFQVRIYCRFGAGDYPLGHFSVHLTDSAAPLDLGLPAPVIAALQLPPGQRDDARKQQLANYFNALDPDLRAKRFELAKQKRPLPPDPEMEKLKVALTAAETPIRQDAQLLQLRQDFRYSTEQSANQRLTAAQDLTWALINNPAFLFNH